jgi:ribosomal protein S18 acetylase RimI-like enzyme
MGITVSPMIAEDLDTVLALWAATEGVGLNESDTPDHLRAYLERNPSLSMVARDGTKLVAAILCGHDGRRGYLNHLAVAPEYRNRGLGTQIVETCLASLSALGILRCNIFVYVDNERGERFWTRGGWAARSDLKTLQRATASVKL